jgi:nitrous oxidase accessory protein NosD
VRPPLTPAEPAPDPRHRKGDHVSRRRSRKVTVLGIAVASAAWLLGSAVGAAPAAAHPHRSHTFVVSARASTVSHSADREHRRSCRHAGFTTIGAAVAAASAGDTVLVCPGTYAEDVLVNKSLHLVGRHATIDATGLENAMQVVTSWVPISGFRLANANGEGLLVGVDSLDDAGLLTSQVLTHVRVDRVAAVHNDKGFNGTENGNCKYPGDCGGGIHLNVTKWSSVRDSVVIGNADGILVTDDYGPSSHNLIEGNYVADNPTECGIVLPSHNSGAVSFDPQTFAVTGRNPAVGGVFDNVVRDNVTVRNGTAKAPPQFGGGGSGSGIGVFGSGPGTGAYDNLIVDNYSAGNGLAGFTIHAHHPGGEDVNGNAVVDNIFGTNNVGGDGYDGPPGPMDFQTTGIAVFSVPPVEMTITHNRIFNNEIGIWLSDTVTAHGLSHNRFFHVTTPVVRG